MSSGSYVGSGILGSKLPACMASASATVSSPLPLYLFSEGCLCRCCYGHFCMCLCAYACLHVCMHVWVHLHVYAHGYGDLRLTPSVSPYCSLLSKERSLSWTQSLPIKQPACHWRLPVSIRKVLGSQAATTPDWPLCGCWVPWLQPPRGQQALYLQSHLPRSFLVFLRQILSVWHWLDLNSLLTMLPRMTLNLQPSCLRLLSAMITLCTAMPSLL